MHELKVCLSEGVLHIRVLFLGKPRSAQATHLTNETMPSNLKELFGTVENLECFIESCQGIRISKEEKKMGMELEINLAMGRSIKKGFTIDLEEVELLIDEIGSVHPEEMIKLQQ